MNNKGQISTVSHVLLWIVALGVVGWLVWSATHTKINNEDFTDGAQQVNNYHVTRNYALVALDLALTPFNIHGCTRQDSPPEAPENEVVNGIQINYEVGNDTN